MHNYRELKIWQKAIDLSIDTYALVEEFPDNEKLNLSSQVRRSAVSVASNIAEGAGRNSDKDFLRFLGIALGSAYELQTQLEISFRLQFISNKDFEHINNSVVEVSKMIWGFQKNLKSNVSNL